MCFPHFELDSKGIGKICPTIINIGKHKPLPKIQSKLEYSWWWWLLWWRKFSKAFLISRVRQVRGKRWHRPVLSTTWRVRHRIREARCWSAPPATSPSISWQRKFTWPDWRWSVCARNHANQSTRMSRFSHYTIKSETWKGQSPTPSIELTHDFLLPNWNIFYYRLTFL